MFQDPSDLIYLYNSVIQHMCSVVSQDDLYTYSWPVSEFANSTDHGTSLLFKIHVLSFYSI